MLHGAQESKNGEVAKPEPRENPLAERNPHKLWKGVWFLLLLLASVEFVARGPWRAISDSGDFAVPYLSARAWLRGDNPYDHNLLDQLWAEAGGSPESKPLKSNTPAVYPPTTLAAIAPLALLNWPAASATLLLINSLFALCSLAAMASTAGLNWREPRGGLFLVLGLAFAPLHTGIAHGNLIIPAAASAILAIWVSSRKRNLLAGALLALATCLKPQIGGVVLLGYAIRRRWRICALAGVLLLALAGLSVLRLEIAGIDWLPNWLSNSADFAAAGGANDPTAANRSRHHLINLHWPLYAIFDQAQTVNLLVFLFAGVLLLIYLFTIRREPEGKLLSISAIAVLSLAVIYHRFYDAVLLLLPLAWSLTAWRGQLKRVARLSFLLILPFLIPGAVMLQELSRAGRLPAFLNDSWWWNRLVLPHQVWAVALLAICLVYAQARTLKPVTTGQ
ncbi:MAG: glycosyltransferase 87 family protein [Blastocatellales bacterium]